MDIHVSSPRAEQLARELTTRTGESLTQAVNDFKTLWKLATDEL